VYEDIFTGLTLDKTIALAGVEPLHSSLFLHFFRPSLSMSCLPTLAFSNRKAVGASNPHKNGLQVCSCSPLNESKGMSRATNANIGYHNLGQLSMA
jgi:hypothetical protein